MARALGDVLHHFDPRLGAPAAERPAAGPGLRVVAAPADRGDLLRAAAVWNLAVEIARRGSPALLVAPARAGAPAPWADPGPGPVGARVASVAAEGAVSLARAARAHAAALEPLPPRVGLALALLPATGFERAFERELDWALLLTAPERRALRATERAARGVIEARPDARVGVTVHGARSVGEARDAFLELAAAVENDLGRGLRSYGLLVDDLGLYRAIVERRPVGLSRPRSGAARALADVAGLLLADAEDAGA